MDSTKRQALIIIIGHNIGPGTWHIGHNFRLEDKQKTLMKYGVVYKLTCSCGSSYIGQTRRNLINRLKEHSSSDKSEVCRHLMAILTIK